MAGLRNQEEVVERINLLRKVLENHLNCKQKITENTVVRISQELDELIVEYYRSDNNKVY